MALVRKDLPGTVPGYEWHKAGDVVDVHDALAHELFRIPGFTEVLTKVIPDTASSGTGVHAAPDERRRRVTRKGAGA